MLQRLRRRSRSQHETSGRSHRRTSTKILRSSTRRHSSCMAMTIRSIAITALVSSKIVKGLSGSSDQLSSGVSSRCYGRSRDYTHMRSAVAARLRTSIVRLSLDSVKALTAPATLHPIPLVAPSNQDCPCSLRFLTISKSLVSP